MANRLALAGLVASYLILGTAYAVGTPKWETPDEPAHYNYIVHLATAGQLPILQAGDYNAGELERLKAAKFPDGMSIDGVRYEFHQPPLFYLLALPIYRVSETLPLNSRVILLRLVSVLLGALVLVTAYTTAREIFPDREAYALGTAAFAATVPMHIAMTAAVNNDTLAELVLSALVLFSIKRLKDEIPVRRYVVVMGLLFGLGLLTKVTVYVAAAIMAAAEAGRWWTGKRDLRQSAGALAGIFALSLAIGGWWFWRNAQVYGDFDLLGRARHDLVVMGQPRTVLGWPAAVKFITVTFKSFWAQFGWMGLLVDNRIYLALFLLCALASLGLIIYLVRRFAGLSSMQKWGLGLLALSFLLIFGGMVQYNLTFDQSQGRYLFPAIIPLGLFFVVGLDELFSRPLLFLMAQILGWLWIAWQARARSLLAVGAGGTVVFTAIAWLEKKMAFALLYLALLALDVICLVRFIIPYFAG